MTTARTILLALMIGLCLPSLSQSTRIDGGVLSKSRFGFYWETRLEPPSPPLADSFSPVTTAADGSDIIYRIMRDRSRRICFGYQAQVDLLPEPNSYRVTFRDLGMSPEEALSFFPNSGDPSGCTLLSTPGWGIGAPQTVRGGDVVGLPLLTNSATGQRIVDYITIQEPARPPVGFETLNLPSREFAFAPGSPRDFRVDDAELQLRGPRLSINGKLDSSTSELNAEVSGSVVWIYVANHGRFLLSLTPHPELGFRKAGEVRGSALSFTVGADKFSLSAAGPIAPRQAAFNLYVFHDSAWKPTYPFADLSAFSMGAADRADSLIGK